MSTMLWFYMGGRWARPLFGTNGVAATIWLMVVIAVGTLLALLLLAIFDRRSTTVLGAAGCFLGVLFLLVRLLLPEALRRYEVDRLVSRQEGERRASAKAWMHSGDQS